MKTWLFYTGMAGITPINGILLFFANEYPAAGMLFFAWLLVAVGIMVYALFHGAGGGGGIEPDGRD